MTDLEKLLNNNVKGGLVNRSPKIVDNLISTPGTRFPRAVRKTCGVSFGHVFPAGVSNTRSYQLCFKIQI